MYERIVQAFYSEPWMLMPEKLEAIAAFIEFAAAGGKYSADQVREKFADREQPTPYMIDIENGDRFALDITAANGGGSPRKGKLVAVLPITGTIMPKGNMLSDFSGGTSVEKLTKQFRSVVNNQDVRAVVLDIDSPGGSVYGIDELASEIRAARDQKKIVAQVNPLAASAAYYLGSAAHEIAMTPSGEVGSIGVFMAHRDLSKAYEEMGVKTTLISAGKYKVEANPYGPLTDEARAFLQQRVNEYYDGFVKAVAEGRGVSVKDVRNGFGQGRVVGADEAKSAGLVDRIATFDGTLERLGAASESERVPMKAAADETQVSGNGAGVDVTTATAETETTEVDSMDEKKTAAGVAGTQVLDAEATRIDGLKKLAAMHKSVVSATQVEKWVADGTSLADAQSGVLARLGAAATPTEQPVVDPVAGAGAQPQRGVLVITDKDDKVAGSIHLARAVRAMARHKGDLVAAAKYAETVLQDKLAASALTASSNSGGGFLVPDQWLGEIIELLRPMSVIRKMGPRTAPLINGQLSIAGKSTGTAASYIGENKAIGTTGLTFRAVKATAKKLAALVPISNDLIRYQGVGPAIDGMVRDDLAESFAVTEDVTFIRGAGTVYTPRGVRNWAPAANLKDLSAGGASQTLAQVRTGLSLLRKTLKSANVRFLKPGWLMSPRTENALMFNVVDGNGNLVFGKEMVENGTLLGIPYAVTTNIPENLGSGSDSELYLVDFADVVIAENPVAVLDMSQEASYVDSSDGQTYSSFQNDQTIIRMIVEHDLVVRHPESIAVGTGLQWT
jgi:HK97 family phage major capsid protein